MEIAVLVLRAQEQQVRAELDAYMGLVVAGELPKSGDILKALIGKCLDQRSPSGW